MRYFILLLFISSCSFSESNLKEKNAILSVLQSQQECWNRGNLECFMTGYWQSDSLKFIGKTGLTTGWNATLENYKKAYPDSSYMGKLEFTILSIKLIENQSAFVIGKWFLKRNKGDIGGHFTLLWKKLNNKWVIVADHSS